jgi:hypothetical protein
MAYQKIFVHPKRVLTRLQVNPDLKGVDDVLLSAISGAQLHIASILDSRFEIRLWDVVYYLDSEAFSGIRPNGQYRMEIPSGFVRKDQPLVLGWDTDWRMPNERPVPTVDYRVDYERGLLYIDAGQVSSLPVIVGYDWANSQSSQYCGYGERYIHVKCTTGFKETDIDDFDDHPKDPLPDWTEEAIISYVGVVLDVSQTANRQQTASALYKRAGDHAMSIIAPYNRRKGLTFRPLSVNT